MAGESSILKGKVRPAINMYDTGRVVIALALEDPRLKILAHTARERSLIPKREPLPRTSAIYPPTSLSVPQHPLVTVRSVGDAS